MYKKKAVSKSTYRLIIVIILLYFLIFTFQQNVFGGSCSDIIYEFRTEIDYPLFSSNEEMLNWAIENGYERVMVKIIRGNKYQFPSPTLESTGDYVFVEDKLTPFVKLSHSVGLPVIVNIEAINPHFSLNPPFGEKIHEFTIPEITSICQELIDIGVDGIAEEDFDAAPECLKAISEICAKNRIIHIHFTNSPVICGYFYWHSVPTTVFETYKDLDEIQSLDYTFDRTNCQVCGSFQGNTLVYGVAKGLGLKLDLKTSWGAKPSFTTSYDQGESGGRVRWVQQSPAMMKHLMLIRALQFDLNSIAICFWADPPTLVDISEHKELIEKFTAKQVKKPIFNLIIPLNYDDNWRNAQYSSDAICDGALLSGYDLVATDRILSDADAYYIVTGGFDGQKTKDIPDEIVKLFKTKKPVFLQCVDYIPSGKNLTSNWSLVLEKLGVNIENVNFKLGDLPYFGLFKGSTYIYSGYQFGSKSYPRRRLIHQGTIIPLSAINGDIHSNSDQIPLLIGKDNKYLFTGSCLNHENSFVIANLLANTLQKPADVFGVVGERISAFFAVNNTALEIRLPTVARKIHLLRYNGCGYEIQNEGIAYIPPYKTDLLQGDLLIIEAK